MADLADAHRVSVSRALTRLCDAGLLRRTSQRSGEDGRFGGRAYEAIDADGNLPGV